MLIVSREALVKIGKHAWNVYPLEAFGYLLGREAARQVLASLPCSKTSRWYEYDDRWLGIEEHLSKACATGKEFGLDVAGFYASTLEYSTDYPIPSFIMNSGRSVMLYTTICCHSCSQYRLWDNGRWLIRREGFVVCGGKRLDGSVNQKRILKAWRRNPWTG